MVGFSGPVAHRAREKGPGVESNGLNSLVRAERFLLWKVATREGIIRSAGGRLWTEFWTIFEASLERGECGRNVRISSLVPPVYRTRKKSVDFFHTRPPVESGENGPRRMLFGKSVDVIPAEHGRPGRDPSVNAKGESGAVDPSRLGAAIFLQPPRASPRSKWLVAECRSRRRPS